MLQNQMRPTFIRVKAAASVEQAIHLTSGPPAGNYRCVIAWSEGDFISACGGLKQQQQQQQQQ